LCYWAFTRRMKRLHVPIVGPTGRTDPGYVRLSVGPVGQTGRTDCSRTAHIYQSYQCGLLADYNTAYAAAWLVVRWPVGPTSRTLCPHASTVGSAVGRNQTCLILPTVCPTDRTKRLHDTIVGPTSQTDQSYRPVGPTIGRCKYPVTSNVSFCKVKQHHKIRCGDIRGFDNFTSF